MKKPDKFDNGSLFGTPYDITYVRSRIDSLDDPANRALWATLVDQISRCAEPRHGMDVAADARALAREKMKELRGRNRSRARTRDSATA